MNRIAAKSIDREAQIRKNIAHGGIRIRGFSRFELIVVLLAAAVVGFFFP